MYNRPVWIAALVIVSIMIQTIKVEMMGYAWMGKIPNRQ
jgi:hypothetical protein